MASCGQCRPVPAADAISDQREHIPRGALLKLPGRRPGAQNCFYPADMEGKREPKTTKPGNRLPH